MASSALPQSVLDSPAALPPPGVIADMANPASIGYLLINIESVLQALMICFVLNRIYTKAFIARKWTWDDLTCLIGFLLTTGYFAITVTSVTQSFVGIHTWDLTVGQVTDTTFLICSYCSEILASPGLGIVKLTFFIMYLQIFWPMRKLKIAIWIGGLFTVLVYLAFSIAWFALGTPSPGQSWQAHFVGSTQAKANGLDFPIPAFGLTIDLYILLVPLIGVYYLQLSTRRKIGLILVFLTAALAIVASALRFVYTVPITRGVSADITYNVLPVFVTVYVEMALGVILTCVPSFSLMLHHKAPPYRSFLSFLSTSISRVTRSQSKGASSYGYSHETSLKPGSFVQLKSVPPALSCSDFGQEQQVKTHISGTKNYSAEEDGVYLTHEIRQYS